MSLPLSTKNDVKVFIDPGHGGHDSGAADNGLLEKDLNLQTALFIKDIFEKEYEGVKVKLSRDTDIYLTLGERCRMANDWGADIFISVHYNAYISSATGFETFRYRNSSGLTSEIHSMIHKTMYKSAFSGKMPDRGSKTSGFYVLRNTKMPAILTEGGFLTNDNDSKHLKSNDFIRNAAIAHTKSIEKIFSSINKRTVERGDEWTGQILRRGESGTLITQLQQALLNKGYSIGKYGADGIFGEMTRDALKQFQKDSGLSADGVAGPKTFNAFIKSKAKVNNKTIIVTHPWVNVRSRPSFVESAIYSQVKEGEIFTVIEEIAATNGKGKLYKLKSGLFITSNSKFVNVREVS